MTHVSSDSAPHLSSENPDINPDINPGQGAVKPAGRRKIWRRLAYSFLIIIILLIIAAIILYFNRNLVYETTVKRLLKSRGYDAALTIDSVTTSKAQIRNIALGQDGAVFFRAKALTLTYDWEELRAAQKIHALTVQAPSLTVEIDKAGKVISPWMPESTGGAALSFPPGGVTLKDGDIGLVSPWGDFDIDGDLSATSMRDFTASLAVESARARLAGFTAPIQAKFDVTSQGPVLTLKDSTLSLAKVTGDSASGEGVTGEGVNIDSIVAALDGTLTRPDAIDGIYTYNGRAALNLKSAKINSLSTGASDFSLTGQIGMDSRDKTFTPGRLIGDFKIDAAALTDADLRLNLARRITLSEALKRAPIAQHFAPGFTRDIESLARRADLSGAGTLDFDRSGYGLTLSRPLSAQGQAAGLVLTPPRSGPALAYDKDNQRLDLSSQIALTGGRDLNLRDFKISGASENGLLWSDVETVSGHIKSRRAWTSGPDISLAPFDAALTYRAGKAPKTGLNAAIAYSGPLLGVEFQDLKAVGALALTNRIGAASVGFTSSEPITAAQAKTSAGLTARGVSLYLTGDAPVYQQRPDGNQVTLAARDVTAQMSTDDAALDFALKAESAHIIGELKADGERWDIQTTAPDLSSDTLAGPGSSLTAPSLSAVLTKAGGGASGDQAWSYDISGPQMAVVAGPVKLSDMTVSVSGSGAGSGADFAMEYSGGLVTLKGSNLPPLPVTGTGKFTQGRFEGRAQTYMPQAPDSPIFADYVYENGAGSAVLDIPKFTFKPGGVQPQTLAPVLKGKIASVDGIASANVILGYRAGQPITSRGTVTLIDMDIGTLVGPFTGVSSTLDFDSLYPLKSSTEHVITMTGFNPGVKLGRGTVRAKVVEGGFDLLDARWLIGDGAISVRPLFWSTAPTAVNTITVGVDTISLGEVFTRLGNESLHATGLISGTLPIVIDGVSLKVNGGRLDVKDGGIIQIKSKDLDKAGEANDVAKIAVTALKELQYEQLSLDVNGPLDGDMRLGIVFTGSNPDVLYGAPFKFNVGVEGELVNIARNLSMSPRIQAIQATLEKESR